MKKIILITITMIFLLTSLSLAVIPGMTVEANAAERGGVVEMEGMTQGKIDVANNAYNNIEINLEFITMSDTAFDDEQVNNYKIRITKASTGDSVSISVRQLPDKANKEGKLFDTSEFRAYSRYYYHPNIMSFEIKNLEPGQKYQE